MKLDFGCISCNLQQVIKIAGLVGANRDQTERIMKDVLQYLSEADYGKSNPEVMGGAWEMIVGHIQNDDPYRYVKRHYNQAVLQMSDTVERLIDDSGDRFQTALKVAIAGNLIDFAASHSFNAETLMARIAEIQTAPLAIDHSGQLRDRLATAKTLLYLGDNCGEIGLDKLFIQEIRRAFPGIRVVFGVRGRAVINDVTRDDAAMVGMDAVAEVMDNGDDSVGTIIERVSDEFRSLFWNADVVIAKGQGNYESLSDVGKDGLFYLLMAKCEPVARLLNVAPLSIVCAESTRLQ